MTKALGMIETSGLAISFLVTEAMLKAANIRCVHQELEEIELVTILVEGDTESVQIAVEAGVEVAKRAGLLFAYDIILQPGGNIKELVESGVNENGETFLKVNQNSK